MTQGVLRRTDTTTDAAPARLVNGNVHRLSAGKVGVERRRRSNPAKGLTTSQSSGAADGHRPTEATATSTPSIATAPGIFLSSNSDDHAHATGESIRRSAPLLLSRLV